MTFNAFLCYSPFVNHSLLEQYQKQWLWRDWNSLYAKLPNANGSLIYDLGCAHGDHSKKLSDLGANVMGLDGDDELLSYAESRCIKNARFLCCDLSNLHEMNLALADGIWMSFVAAYFSNFNSQLNKISQVLKKGGWLATTEMSGLFDHGPLEKKYQDYISKFYAHSFQSNGYDFKSGSKLANVLSSNGFEIKEMMFLQDKELSFQGAADESIVTAWENRLERMVGLKRFMGDDYPGLQKALIQCFRSDNHQSKCKVYFYLAFKK
ncbi:MAG: class I SAM-dependent methyltransferase [Bdellovibrio sp.]|nr:class I SAM-dependent methyltransferase [Bdellovibrio sp.]